LAEVALVLHQLKPAEAELWNRDPKAGMLTLNLVRQHWGFSTRV